MCKGIDVSFSGFKSPDTSEYWKELSQHERKLYVIKNIENFTKYTDFEIIEAKKNGQISININNILSANERGPILLELESFLKLKVDKGITIWHAPIGDRSSLRNLRGIEVLS